MDVLVPIVVAGIMPIAIVMIIFTASMNNDNKRAAVLMKAIESNNSIDADKLAQAMTKPRKTPREILNGRLLRGCIFSFCGIGLIISALLAWANGVEFGADPVSVPMMFGGISLAVGLSFLIVYFVTRKDVGNAADGNDEQPRD